MTPERWPRVKELFQEAQSLEGEARAAFLRKNCGEDAGMRRELASLLAAHDAMGPRDARW